MAKSKRINNDMESTTQNYKDRVRRTPLKTGGELGCPTKVSSSCSTSGTHRVSLGTNPDMNQKSQLVQLMDIVI